MDPQTVFCPNSDCPASGQVGCGNIGIHQRKEGRYICHQCHKTFSARKGTPYYRLRSAEAQVTVVVTLLAYGCPVAAIVAAFQLDERTVSAWQQRAGQHCERVHEQLVQQPRELGHVQADEIRVKQQGQIVWLAMALQVATRLWLGATLGFQRDEALLTRLAQKIRACALCRPLLVCVDGWRGYPGILRHVFREAIPSRWGRPHLRLWDGLVIAQVVKQYEHGRVIGVLHRVVEGTATQVTHLLQQTMGVRSLTPPTSNASTPPFACAWRDWFGGGAVWANRSTRCTMVSIWLARSTTFVRFIAVCALDSPWVHADGFIGCRAPLRWQQASPIIAGRCKSY